MSKRVIYLDDLDATLEADAGTIDFSIEGEKYEIDLSKKNLTKLRNQLGPWIAAARKVGRPSTPAKKKVGGFTGSGRSSEQMAAVREWAGRNGYTVSPKGRIPGEVYLAFDEAQAKLEPQKKIAG